MYNSKFTDPLLKDPLEAVNLFMHEPVPAALTTDMWEPDAINIAFDLLRITWSLMSTNSLSLTRYNEEEMLHCVVTGKQHFSLVSPYQRVGVGAGKPLQFMRDREPVEIALPPHMSPVSLLSAPIAKTA